MRKENAAYYFSVEGETEKWYLEWLQTAINGSGKARYTVKFDVKIQKDPVARVKSMTVLGKTEIVHVFDKESEEVIHTKQFMSTLKRMKEAQRLGKNIKYVMGYSNFTFELWIILHKMDLNAPKGHRKQYLQPINAAFGERFENLDEYKQDTNFHRVLSKLSLEDVKAAIKRAEHITCSNEDGRFKQQEYAGYRFFSENPSLSIWQPIKKILTDCNLL